MQNLPNGAKVLLFQGADGLCYQTGAARMPDGSTCSCGTMPNWRPSTPNRYNAKTYALVSPQAAVQIAQQVAQGSAGLGNSYQAIDLPGKGAAGIARAEGNASPMSGGLVYALVLDNTAGATTARQIIGDYTGTYVLLGNAEATPGGFVIGGSWATNSKTQFAGRTAFRPWKVNSLQLIASDESFFNLTSSYYFDTKPTPNGPVKDSLTLTNLLSPDQFNPKIQFFNKSMRFDGINGLDITIPAGQRITLQFSIVSEGSAGDQVLFS